MINLLLAALLSVPSLACTEFSGKYLSYYGDTDINLTWTQAGCDSAHGHYDHGYGGYINERTMIFDGVKRRLETEKGYLWLEGFHWEGAELRVENEYHTERTNS